MTKQADPAMSVPDRPVLEIENANGVEAAVLDWLTENQSLHLEGGLGSVAALVRAIQPHLRIFQDLLA